MSINVVCDNCGNAVEFQPSQDESVKRWHRLDSVGARAPAHFCSWRCLREYAAAIVEDEEKDSQPKEPPC